MTDKKPPKAPSPPPKSKAKEPSTRISRHTARDERRIGYLELNQQGVTRVTATAPEPKPPKSAPSPPARGKDEGGK